LTSEITFDKSTKKHVWRTTTHLISEIVSENTASTASSLILEPNNSDILGDAQA